MEGAASVADLQAWPRKHLQSFEGRGLDWFRDHVPAASCKKAHPGLNIFLEREFESLHLAGVTCFPEPETRVFDMSQSIDRSGSSSSAYAGAVIPRVKRYITSQCRATVGLEEMRLQSLWFPEDVLAQFDDNLLFELAGNAFEVSCASAVFFLRVDLLVF